VKYVLKTAAPARVPFDLERDLNPQQRAVVEAPPGEILVLAGAGTGKTRTLTYRVARLVAAGCPAERVLLVTFTNRAAREMVARVEALLSVDMRRAAAGTFHHVGNRILRRHAEAVGLGPDFSILDPEDARNLLASTIAELGIEALTARRFPEPKVLYSMIGLSTGTTRPLASIIEWHFPRFIDQTPAIERVAERFAVRKRRLNAVDFDDLLELWLRLLRDPSAQAAGDALRAAFDHVLVDEYQDINALQGALVDAMATRARSLTCVGDDAQSIYSFRGADFSQIHDFRLRHPGAAVMPLTINYRSTPQILELANRSIGHNREQHPKQLQAVREPGAAPALVPLRDVYQQAELVAQRLLELHHEHDRPLSRMAVLYRNHSHGLELQVELTRRQIPFTVRSGVRFFEQTHVKDVVAYLRAHHNPRDSLAWLRLLKLWPGVGASTAERVAGALSGEDGSAPGGSVSETLATQAGLARGRAAAALERLGRLWERFGDPDREIPGAQIRLVVAEHYAEYADRTFPNAPARRDDLENLAAFADRYPSAEGFLSELALIQGLAAESLVGGEEPDDRVVLSTIHQAKGLEWSVVFVIWLAEGRFPTTQSLRLAADVEEERRLFYVATTRAQDELYLCYPTVEEGRDGPSHLLRPSRFVAELDVSPPVFERWTIEEAPPA
jgi:DNA helicase-2/ATP-dependent DNA helicase PcrA